MPEIITSPCPKCGSVACLQTGGDICRHTRLKRIDAATDKALDMPPRDKQVKRATNKSKTR